MSKTILKINPEYESLHAELKELLLNIVANKDAMKREQGNTDFLPKSSEYIYRGRNNLYRIKLGGKSYILKDFRRPHIVNRYVYTGIRKSKAARSYHNALKLIELGFNTPYPVAYFEIRRNCALLYSFYISEELGDAHEMRHWENYPDIDVLLPQFAKEILRLHKAGVWHKDFSPGNILFIRENAKIYKFYHVDLNRMKFGVSDHRKLMRMFRALNLQMSETENIARLYARAAGLDEELIVGQAKEQLQTYLRKKRGSEKG